MATTGFGLTAQEYYYYGEGLDDLAPDPRRYWTPNYSGAGTVLIPEAQGTPTATARDNTGAEVALGTATDITPPITEIGLNTFTGQITDYRVDGRHYPSVIRSETMPDSLVLVDELGDGTTDGILTDFPAAQPWVPVLGSGQAYLSNLTGSGGFVNGLRADPARVAMTSLVGDDGVSGSWGSQTPPVGSILTSNAVVCQVTSRPTPETIDLVLSGSSTRDEIQAAYEYPNVFDVDVFDSATEAYAGDFNASGFIRGVNVIAGSITRNATGGSGVFGSWSAPTSSRFNIGDILTVGNGASVSVRSFSDTGNTFSYDVITGTPEQIQTGFQWPNHFTVTPP